MPTSSQSVDRAHELLYSAGWSTGDTVARMNGDLVWLMHCHRGAHCIMTKGSSREDAWIATLNAANALK
jgi:hypothetical protein